MMINSKIDHSLNIYEKPSKDEEHTKILVANREAIFFRDIGDLSNDCACSPKSHRSQHLVDNIINTVKSLEQIITSDHQKDFKLRMVLGRQAEQLQELHMSLDVEKKRTQRLIELARGVYCTDEESETDHRNDSFEGFSVGSISPLLMHQRFEELSSSYKHCRKMLSSRNIQLKKGKCDIEQLQASFDYLMEEYQNMQKRLEILCHKYFRMQEQKNQEIEMLRVALCYASECVITAQDIIEDFSVRNNMQLFGDPEIFEKFRENLELFKKSLGSCEWIKSHLNSLQIND